MPPVEEIVEEEQWTGRQIIIMTLEEANDQLGKGDNEKNWLQGYSVDHIVKNVTNGRQQKYVVRQYGYMS